MEKEIIDDVVETVIYNDADDRLIVHRSQDAQPYLDANAVARNATPEFGKYQKNLTHVMSIPATVIEMMMLGQCCTDGKRYNLMSTDQEERRRALVHVQTEHKALLTINGNPFSKKRMEWH